jgi:hypothetical protein
MNIVTLKTIHQEEPLLPPGVEYDVNMVVGPVERLVADFTSWASRNNRKLENMTEKEIYRQLSELGGIGSGPITPQTWEAGRRPANPLVVEQARQQLRDSQGTENECSEAPLLPPGI